MSSITDLEPLELQTNSYFAGFSHSCVSAHFWPFLQLWPPRGRAEEAEVWPQLDEDEEKWMSKGLNSHVRAVIQLKFLEGRKQVRFQPFSWTASWLSALRLSGRLLSSSDVGEKNSMFSWCAAVASQHLSVWVMFASGCLQTGAFKVLQREDPSPEPSQRNPAEPPPNLIVLILFQTTYPISVTYSAQLSKKFRMCSTCELSWR